MAARGIDIYTIEFPDPAVERDNDRTVTLPSNISFQYPIQHSIQTLSAKSVERGSDPYGILYVPDLTSNDCKEAEGKHVAANVTRLAQLPQSNEYALIAVAPWFSGPCMDEYFQAARHARTKAFMVYQPGDSNTMPPPMSDPSWNLSDGGAWKSSNTFPTYAIISNGGETIMRELSYYSGNITDAPFNESLSEIFQPSDYIRLWATVSTDSGSQLPSLWVFLVIVLGLLIIVIFSTSSWMHLVQRRRRNSLRRRVMNGEVNLEALGVKRLTVPQTYLDKLPLFIYTGLTEGDLEKRTPKEPAQAHNTNSHNRRSSAPTVAASTNAASSFSQPTCPICIDDFEPNETQVRQLPCRHIYHPDCIDTFLLSNSSLCPMCKTSVLPEGFCPTTITNVMVRRERMIRRMQRNAVHRANPNNPPIPHQPVSTPIQQNQRAFGSLGNRIGGALSGRRVFSAPERRRTEPPDIELGTNPASSNLNTVPEITPVPPAQFPQQGECSQQPHSQQRREWARQRALSLLGDQHAQANAEEEEVRGPRWKRGLRKIFPGFR